MSELSWTIRKIWNNGLISGGANSNGNEYVDKIFTTTTLSGETCTAAWDQTNNTPPDPYRISRMRFNGTYDLIEDLIYQNQNISPVNIVNLSAASNDVHVVWKDNLSNNKLRYKYYDDIPLVPENLDVEIYEVGRDNYPKLTWDLSIDPDVYFYDNAIDIERRISINGGPWSSWAHLAYANGYDSEYIDYTIGNCYPEANTAEYRIRAIDNNSHTSDFTHPVSINFSQFYKLSQTEITYDYQLGQNYPNPFNPATTIPYSLAEDGFVAIKVYDMLGNELSELVNSNQSAGNYELNFNASELSSGIYVYRITAMNRERTGFSDTKQMILLK